MGKRKQQRDDNIRPLSSRKRDKNIHPHSSGNKELPKEQNVGEGNDIISSLPENVLHHILSFLSTKDAIRTSILSTKWEYLWTSIANIDLKEKYPLYGKKDWSFLDFVERVLSLHDASDIKSLRINSYELVNSSHVNSWISTSIRHNIEELNLSLPWKAQVVLPCCLFTCQSLVVLKLLMNGALNVPSLIQFSNLKTLELSELTFSDDDSTQHLFSSCTVLQELALVNCSWENLKTIVICIPTLKRLTIETEYMEPPDSEDVHSCVTKIYAANLIHLHFTRCLMVDFRLYDLSSLVDATTILFYEDEDVVEEVIIPRVLGLLTAICNVRKLTTTTDAFMGFDVDFSDGTWMFGRVPSCFSSSLKTVRIAYFDGKRIEIKGFNPYDEDDWMFGRVPSCFATSLKTVCIEDFDEKPVEMRFIKFLPTNARVLERLTLRAYLEDMQLLKNARVLDRLTLRTY
ncbi:hypothetical protein Vadar_008732 [Vaccinium darrowii]|uniref:Uncharacterized protein n=1 Tax=Vaccinium darrowii TaxID=229202 RepID=A0ACB7XPJ7_9ERIC|nr:hypothetical protein Vadar_008732 [Vaccinium darrowii]